MFHILPHSKMVVAANHALGRWVRMQGSLQRFDALLATSEPAAEFAERTLGIPAKVLGLPIELDKFTGARPFDRYRTGQTVMFLGRLVERKGCQYLLQAVHHAIQAGTWPKDARVVVCGFGHLESKLKNYAATYGFADRVEFAGFIKEEDKPRYLASADVVVYPSTGGESFGIVLLEAMAASRGVVLAGNNPGYASVMAPRPDSLFNPHDAAVLADKIIAALSDRKLANAAVAWQEQYVKEFDINVVGKHTVEVYEQALRRRRS
jgi:phosphatidylinositol alpha-mannosyltransferase